MSKKYNVCTCFCDKNEECTVLGHSLTKFSGELHRCQNNNESKTKHLVVSNVCLPRSQQTAGDFQHSFFWDNYMFDNSFLRLETGWYREPLTPPVFFSETVRFRFNKMSAKHANTSLELRLRAGLKFSIGPIDIVSSQLYMCHILVSKKCQLQAGTIHREKSC